MLKKSYSVVWVLLVGACSEGAGELNSESSEPGRTNTAGGSGLGQGVKAKPPGVGATEDPGNRGVAGQTADFGGTAPVSIDGVLLLEDCEDGDTATLANAAGVVGFWFTFDDRSECDNPTSTGETWPTPGGDDFQMAEFSETALLPPPEGEANAHGLRFVGKDHALWGAGVGFELANGLPYDLQEGRFVGVRFWGISPAGEQQLEVRIPDSSSNPSDGNCLPRLQDTCGVEGCFADPAVSVLFGPNWQLYQVYFTQSVSSDPSSEAIRIGPMVAPSSGVYREGYEKPNALDTSRAYRLLFNVGKVPDPGFDILIDNVGLIIEGGEEDITQ